MKKKKRGGKKKESIEGSNPLITINEPDECLFAIVDFSAPGINHVRRIISKKNLKNGKITAVVYQGEVGADNLCVNKRDIRELKDATPERFWKSVNTISELYRLAGGTSDIRLYEGKTMKESAELMQKLNHAKVQFFKANR